MDVMHAQNEKPEQDEPPAADNQHAFVEGVLAGDRTVLARAITLIESSRAEHQAQAQELLTALMPHTGGATRVGITGVPGVGKSTLIDRFGVRLVQAGHRVAVLAVDPSSSQTGGSILGDKTRMAALSREPNAFIRPSPAGKTLGGVTRRTRETLLLCEAAGFDVVIVETVGVGQSETVVAEMVDVFLTLMLPGAGDDLQGIKRGLLEWADVLAVNKADGDNRLRTEQAANTYRLALGCMQRRHKDWPTPVVLCSAKTGDGLDELWQTLQQHRRLLSSDGSLAARRRQQELRWLHQLIDERFRQRWQESAAVRSLLPALESQVAAGTLPAPAAADQLLRRFDEANATSQAHAPQQPTQSVKGDPS